MFFIQNWTVRITLLLFTCNRFEKVWETPIIDDDDDDGDDDDDDDESEVCPKKPKGNFPFYR